jgi:hypothetical protein
MRSDHTFFIICTGLRSASSVAAQGNACKHLANNVRAVPAVETQNFASLQYDTTQYNTTPNRNRYTTKN